jgi:hypothetical protein
LASPPVVKDRPRVSRGAGASCYSAARPSQAESSKEEAMAKAKTKKKKSAKVRDLRARKQVKGGARRTEDPCMGGEVTRLK